MAVKSRDEILNALKEKLGDDTSDESLALVEDVTDTLTDFESRTNDSTNWKNKYEENDKQWRQRYRDRFYGAKDDEDDDDDDEPRTMKTFDDLFKKGK